MTAVTPRIARMALPDFLRWEPNDGRRYELADGEPRAMAPTSNVHGFLQAELCAMIRNHLRAGDTGCEVVIAPGIIPQLISAHNFRIPDLGVTCAPILPGQPNLPAPVLLVEILSPGNQAKTWSNVWAYTSIPSLAEILVLHSGRIAAEILRRTPEGTWPERTEEVLEGSLTLTSIGLVINMAELYARSGLAA
jgi:Uma2 family endonuclease